jgi:hypothetical protein
MRGGKVSLKNDATRQIVESHKRLLHKGGWWGCYQWRIVHCKRRGTDAFIVICNIKYINKFNKNKRSKFIIQKA